MEIYENEMKKDSLLFDELIESETNDVKLNENGSK